MKQHDLKILPPFFVAVSRGEKLFELRKNDRDFQPGEVVFLREWSKKTDQFTGRIITAEIGFVYKGNDYGLKEGYCVFSLIGIKREKDEASSLPPSRSLDRHQEGSP